MRLVVLVSRGEYGGGLEDRSVDPRDLLDLGLLLYICKINMRSIVNSKIKIEQNIFEKYYRDGDTAGDDEQHQGEAEQDLQPVCGGPVVPGLGVDSHLII